MLCIMPCSSLTAVHHRLQERVLGNGRLVCHVVSPSCSSVEEALKNIVVAVREFADVVKDSTRNDGVSVGRIFIPRLSAIMSLFDCDSEEHVETTRRALGRCLIHLKSIVQSCIDCKLQLMVCLQSDAMAKTVRSTAVDLADAVLAVESFSGRQLNIPPEFKEFCGFLHLHRLPSAGSLAAHSRPKFHRFGLKRTRRKLHVEPLHLPPEESRATASDTQRISGMPSGTASRAPGSMCSAGSSIDF